MKIKDLRRAETQIDEEIDYSVRMLRSSNEYGKLHQAEDAGAELAEHYLDKVGELTEAKYTIRALVSAFNEEYGINERCIKIAKAQAKLDVINTIIAELSSPRTQRIYNSDVIRYSVGLSEQAIDFHRATARGIIREIQSLKDSCNGINSQQTVMVPPTLLAVLTKYNLA